MILNKELHPITKNNPEKVLQFGTGVLLRGLCDYAIDKANKKGVFNGSVVVVKSTPGSLSDFNDQDNLYTVCVRGLDNGKIIEENIINESISRVISAASDWDAFLETAENPQMNVVISNTTEVGLQYHEENLGATCPSSFPGKLTLWLKKRFDSGLSGVVIIPTELVVDNGMLLKSFVIKHAQRNQLGGDFVEWIENENDFCNSLVDRIVPGKPEANELEELKTSLGYEDNLILKCEAYKLWAIEGGDRVKDILSFEEVDKNIVVAKDITQYRELKLRMLNAPHTLMSGLAFLSGFEHVKDALNDGLMEKFMTILMLTEMAPALPANIDAKLAQRYGREVMDRFRNPYLNHKWHSITLQYSMKMKNRVMPLLYKYYEIFETVPQYLARCFAAYLLFMKSVEQKDGKFYGESHGEKYLINDDQAPYFHELWTCDDPVKVTKLALSNEELWGTDLTQLNGLESNVAIHLSNMQMAGVREVAAALNVYA
ncbi:tagaturonate reductase [Spirosomataceae bacterium TFI 002]|nr:tagaturonate reductase [Spirosomataceae bacterium TFI 002]